MFRIISRILVCFALIQLMGAHWATLQVVAWGGMLVSYSQETGLSNGVVDTFSGEKPCGLCDAILSARGVESEEERSPVRDSKKLPDLAAKWMLIDLPMRVGDDIRWRLGVKWWAPLFTEEVPTPPPRLI